MAEPSQADCIALAILLACAERAPPPIPRSWRVVSDRLAREGKLRFTATPRVFRISEEGRAEVVRLRGLGASPPPFARSPAYAHDGAQTTTGRETNDIRRAREARRG